MNTTEVKTFWESYFQKLFSVPLEKRKEYMYEIKYLEKIQDSKDVNSYQAFNNIFTIYMSNNTFDTYKNSEKEKYDMISISNKFISKGLVFEIIKKIINTSAPFFYTKEDYTYLKNNGWNNISPHLRHMVCNRSIFEDECKKSVSSTHIYLLNKMLIEVYKLWDKNYDVYITQNNDHIKIKSKWFEIISNYKSKNNIKDNSYDKIPSFFITKNRALLSEYIFENPTKKCEFSLLLFLMYDNDYDTIYEIWSCLHNYLVEENNKIIAEQQRIIQEQEQLSKQKVPKEKVVKEKVVKEKVVKEKVPKKEIIVENEESVDNSDNDDKTAKKKKKKSIPATLKRKVWAKWVGEEVGKTQCLCCKLTDITQMSFHCGHIISEANGGELKMDNLKPICQSCNSSMGTKDMNEFMSQYGF